MNITEIFPNEILYKILFPMPYKDIIAYCSTNKSSNNICQDDIFWLMKLDQDIAFKPSNYVHNYSHPDVRGFDIYKRWHTTVTKSLLPLINYGYNDLVVWILQRHSVRCGNERDLMYVANYAAKFNNIEILSYLEETGIVPDNNTVSSMEGYSIMFETEGFNLDTLKWLKQTGFTLDARSADRAINNDDMDMLEWLIQQNVLPSDDNLWKLIQNHHLDILYLLEKRGCLPSSSAANIAVASGDLDSIEWLARRGINIDTQITNVAAEYGRLDILKHFAQSKLLPSIDGVIWQQRMDILMY